MKISTADSSQRFLENSKISADSADSSQIFLENSYISAKCLQIIYRYFTDRGKPAADNCSAVTDMLQIFADI